MFGGKETHVMTSDGRSGAHGGLTVIARGVKVEGSFQSPGDVTIEGNVEGSLSAGGVLTIGVEAHIRADVRANEAHVAGTIEGNVTLTKRLELAATAKITGDVTCETISIEAGACVNGKIAVGAKTATAMSSESSAVIERGQVAVGEA